jgi:hypothetical protein
VANGIVMLTGEVTALVERNRAETAVLRVPGVRAVADELIVESAALQERSVQLAEAALDALSLAVPGSSIQVVVRQGVVRLDGTVEGKDQQMAAVTAIAGLPGVKDVVSMLVTRSSLASGSLETRVREATSGCCESCRGFSCRDSSDIRQSATESSQRPAVMAAGTVLKRG